MIDKTVIQSCKKRPTNLAMAWLHYKKAYDLVPKLVDNGDTRNVGAAENIKLILNERIKMWKTQLTANNDTIGEVAIKRGIFKGDSLSPLQFKIAMSPLIRLSNSARKREKLINYCLWMMCSCMAGMKEKLRKENI